MHIMVYGWGGMSFSGIRFSGFIMPVRYGRFGSWWIRRMKRFYCG